MTATVMEVRKPPGIGYRWTIVALLFAATTINYIDRQVLGILAPTLTQELGWSEAQYGAIVSWFSLAYGIGLLLVGRALDWIGVRRGFSIAIVVWSLAAMAHAAARTVFGFSFARALLGACDGAKTIVAYNAPFEVLRIKALEASFPELASKLAKLRKKVVDLLPIVRDRVYHPAFGGSFSIKYVLKPLVPDLSYRDLIIVDGLTASVEIARLLFVSGKIAPAEHARVRKELLDYCERDTWAMVRLLERLRELAA